MSALIARVEFDSDFRWARLTTAVPHRPEDKLEVELLNSTATTTAALIAELATGNAQVSQTATVSGKDFLSPVTSDAALICQGLNYWEHAAEAGHKTRKANLFFQKASSSLSGPYDDIIRPEGVELLDYEAEFGAILRRPIEKGENVTPDNVGDYVAGFVLCNDISARDTQFGASFFQWFQGKSYRTFCPTGPVLYLLEPEEVVPALENLHFSLEFRGDVRQSASSTQLIYKVPETLTQLAEIIDLKPGDMLLTGTPGGVLAHPGPEILEILKTHIFDDATRKGEFVDSFKKKDPFLQPGDTLTLSFKDNAQGIDLGGQYCRITQGDRGG